MKPKSETERHNRQDWGIVLLILLMGLCCVVGAGQWALRLSPSWKLDTDMNSGIDPYSDFQTKPVDFIEPLDAGILTQPAWVKVFLTPGAIFATGTPPPTGGQANNVPTQGQATTAVVPLTAISVTVAAPTTAVPTNTFVWIPVPPTVTPKKGNPPPPDTPTNTPIPPPSDADLAITITDSAMFYISGDTRTYTIQVSNLIGPGSINGVTVTNSLLGPGSSVSWSCVPSGTFCGGGGLGDINDVVDLPFGSSIIYTVDVTATAPGADIVNTAFLTLLPGASDPNLGNNADDDTDTLFAIPGGPPPSVDTYDNRSDYCLDAGNPSITFTVSAAIDDDGIPDLIYYEEPQTLPTPPFPPGTPGILMDKIVIEISDGFNWYLLFNWGDNAANNNAPNLVVSPCGAETDNCPIPAGSGLTNDTGILLNIPASLQNGLTSYIRITLLPEGPPDDGNACIDGMVPY